MRYKVILLGWRGEEPQTIGFVETSSIKETCKKLGIKIEEEFDKDDGDEDDGEVCNLQYYFPLPSGEMVWVDFQEHQETPKIQSREDMLAYTLGAIQKSDQYEAWADEMFW